MDGLGAAVVGDSWRQCISMNIESAVITVGGLGGCGNRGLLDMKEWNGHSSGKVMPNLAECCNSAKLPDPATIE